MDREFWKFCISEIMSEEIRKSNNIIAVLPGRFQPFHKGHYEAYKLLMDKSGAGVENTFIISADPKKNDEKNPLSFENKQKIISSVYGIPKKNIILSKGSPYHTRNNKENKLSEWMSEVVQKTGFAENDFVLVIGYGEDDANSRASSLEVFKPNLNNSFWDYKPYKVVLPRTMSGTESRNIILSKSLSKKEKFNRIFGKPYDENIYNILQNSIPLTESVNVLREGVGFGFIKHVEDLSAEELLLFLKMFNKHEESLIVNEKVDGHFYKFGLKNGKFFTEDSSGMRSSVEEYPDVYFFDDFRKFHKELSEVDFVSVMKNMGVNDPLNFTIESESIPFFNYNAIMYNPKIIKDGIIVMFNIIVDGEKRKIDEKDGFSKKLTNELNKESKVIKFYSNPNPNIKHISIPQKYILKLEDIISKFGNVLKSTSRKHVDVQLRKRIKNIVNKIGKMAKGHVLKADFNKSFGSETEGLVFYTPGGDIVKIVDKDFFLTRKKEFWKFIDVLNSAVRTFKNKIKKNPSSLNDELSVLKNIVDSVEKDFLSDPNQIKNEKKRSDTYEHIDMVKKQIEKYESLMTDNVLYTESTGEGEPLDKNDVEFVMDYIHNILSDFNKELSSNGFDQINLEDVVPHGSGKNVLLGKQKFAGDVDVNLPLPGENIQDVRRMLRKFINNNYPEFKDFNSVRGFLNVNGKSAEIEFFNVPSKSSSWAIKRGTVEANLKGAFVGKIYNVLSDMLNINMQWEGVRVKFDSDGNIVGSRKKGKWVDISLNPRTVFNDIVEFFSKKPANLKIAGIPDDVTVSEILGGLKGMIKELDKRNSLPNNYNYSSFIQEFKSKYIKYISDYAKMKSSDDVKNQFNKVKKTVDSLKESHSAVENNSALDFQYYKSTIKNALSLIGLDGIRFEQLGSKKRYAGDIDIGVDVYDLMKKWKLTNKDSLFEDIDKILSTKKIGYKVVKGLSQFHISIPVVDDKGMAQKAIDENGKVISDDDAIVQLDIMIGNLHFMKDILSGSPLDSKYKAKYRNMFLMSILKEISEETDVPNVVKRYQINFKSGFQSVLQKPKIGKSGQILKSFEKSNIKNIGDANDIASFLFGINVKWSDINSFEKLISKFKSSQFKYKNLRSDIIKTFKKILSSAKTTIPSEVN